MEKKVCNYTLRNWSKNTSGTKQLKMLSTIFKEIRIKVMALKSFLNT